MGEKSLMEHECPGLGCEIVKTHGSAISEKNTLELKFVRVRYYLKLPSMNFTQRL